MTGGLHCAVMTGHVPGELWAALCGDEDKEHRAHLPS